MLFPAERLRMQKLSLLELLRRLEPSKCARIAELLLRCIIYIVRRTQLYLYDQLWGALHARARTQKTTISELVRQAVRERYLGSREQRTIAMQRFVGTRKFSTTRDAAEEIRSMRRGNRIELLRER